MLPGRLQAIEATDPRRVPVGGTLSGDDARPVARGFNCAKSSQKIVENLSAALGKRGENNCSRNYAYGAEPTDWTHDDNCGPKATSRHRLKGAALGAVGCSRRSPLRAALGTLAPCNECWHPRWLQ